MTEDELRLAVALVAVAARDGDLALKIAAARMLNLEAMQPVSFTYAVCEYLLRDPPLFTVTSNGDGPHDDN